MQHIIEQSKQLLTHVTPGHCPGCSSNSQLIATAIGNLLIGAGLNPRELISSKSGERRSDKTNVPFVKEYRDLAGTFFFPECFKPEEFIHDLETFLATK